MRVIAGTARSLPLKTVPTKDVRPTTDKTKETLFNILMPYIYECRFLDLFAGSGAIGIEAISRGAKAAVFVERDRAAQRVIEENLAFTKFTDKSRLLKMDVLAAPARLQNEEPFDIIFMDPPYDNGLEKQVLELLKDSPLVTDETIIVVEASKETDFSYLESLGFEAFKDKLYKNNRHIFIRKM
ncbi:MAG: 16S rRNA (guanine(966)-N(2))-methyltransferase RsmD [Lachnospiraceae bacterium]|nr:16S rRNA (guanine(966)-N(2))-methyltransferase RsmD [Lachnospiraceae bacterium]